MDDSEELFTNSRHKTHSRSSGNWHVRVTADTVVTVSKVVTAYTVGTVVTVPTEPGVGFGPTEQARSES